MNDERLLHLEEAWPQPGQDGPRGPHRLPANWPNAILAGKDHAKRLKSYVGFGRSVFPELLEAAGADAAAQSDDGIGSLLGPKHPRGD